MQDTSGPNGGRVYAEKREPYRVGAPIDLPSGLTVISESILTWGRDECAYEAHELLARTADGEVRRVSTILQPGGIGDARLSTYRVMGAMYGRS